MSKKAENVSPNSLRLTSVVEHNLKGFDLELHHDQLVVFTGVSGSGKTSLVFDTIFREGERRMLSNLGSRISRLMNRLGRPQCGEANGVRPAIAIDQNSHVTISSSTVGTLSEIGDELRLLFARFSQRHCHNCQLALPNNNRPNQSITCDCGTECPPLSRSLFSFNTPLGACPKCDGLGVEEQVDPDSLIADPEKSLREGALVPTTPNGYIVYSQVTPESMEEVCQAHGFSIDIPWCDLSDEQKHVIYWGSDRIEVAFGKHSLESRMKWSGIKAKPREMGYYRGILRVITETLKKKRNANILRFVSSHPCQACDGTRLSSEARAPQFHDRNIAELNNLSLDHLKQFLEEPSAVTATAHHTAALKLVARITERIDRLIQLSLGHVTLARRSATLSSGESRRLRLATQLGSGLTGICYIFDEPSAGLHTQERQALVNMLCRLRDQGNSVLIVEHDHHFRSQADHLVEIGPGSGRHGGELIYSGKPRPSDKIIPALQFRPTPQHSNTTGQFLELRHASKNNLNDLHVKFQTHALNVVTGLSGAGKTSLIAGCLAQAAHDRNASSVSQLHLHGAESIKHVLVVDQKPIGRSPRSNPATWCGIFDHIRALFANTEAAQAAGFDKGHFSFNKIGGRCESCEGAGVQTVGLMSMPLLTLTCTQCNGNRFDAETLKIRYDGRSVFDILESTIDEAAEIFVDHKQIIKTLHALQSLGLGYLQLGQPSPTLSGGEAQRLKLAKEMARMRGPETLIILDEPTNGLHDKNIAVLCLALVKVIESGCTIVAADHDMNLISRANWLIELGPKGGDKGGQLLFAGRPEDLLSVEGSPTAMSLKQFMHPDPPIDAIQTLPQKERPAPQATSLKGVSTNNLKSIDVTFPHRAITAVGGLSGSGKSSLVFDTLAAEGLGRFAESFSPYLRREIRAHRSGEFTDATGIRATIAIRSKSHMKNRASTVGTHSGIDEGLRLIFARVSRSVSTPNSDEPLSASHFSFNHALGACPQCSGQGETQQCPIENLVVDADLSIDEGALATTKGGGSLFELEGRIHAILVAACSANEIDINMPWKELPKAARQIVARGCGSNAFKVDWQIAKNKGERAHVFSAPWEGACSLVEVEYEKKRDRKAGPTLAALLSPTQCTRCNGSRLNPEVKAHTVGPWTITDLRRAELSQLLEVLRAPAMKAKALGAGLDHKTESVFDHVAQSLIPKIRRLERLGLGHLTLDRSTRSLSTGEARRLDLAKQLTDGLQDICYVLDEPGLGLHAQDKKNLIQVIRELSARGNTVVLVDHDKYLLKQADHIIDLGPQAGKNGGRVVAQGPIDSIIKSVDSPTGLLLRGDTTLEREITNQTKSAGPILRGVFANNLRNFDLQLNYGEILVICGVSGSGKSTLLFDVAAPSLSDSSPTGCDSVENKSGAINIHKIDGQAQGHGPFSVLATFLNLMDPIRKFFAATDDAKAAKLTLKDFAFSSKTGRCPACLGSGETVMPLDFMPDSIATCDSCKGQRFKDEILSKTWQGLSIAEVLAHDCGSIPATWPISKSFQETLGTLNDLGLGHLSLDRRCDSLSGGENARLGIVRQLTTSIKRAPSSIYLFDEASRGLHVEDQAALLRVFEKLSQLGAAVVASEHSLDLVNAADRVVELGPGAGRHGGELVFDGAPTQLRSAETPTGRALSAWLQSRRTN
ncbi:MAG: excinuclease ABC subunit A [Planctomycetota bacterium]|jgi:excinuclease ABC subunit A